MTWSILGASLAAHDLAASAHFFGTLLGLDRPVPSMRADARLRRGTARPAAAPPGRALSRQQGAGVGRRIARPRRRPPCGDRGRCDLPRLPATSPRRRSRISRRMPAEFGSAAVWTLDPALNVVAFCQRQRAEGEAGWHIHHVNIPAADVREATAFYVEMAGLTEALAVRRRRAATSASTRRSSRCSTRGTDSGLHIIRPDPGFALRNHFAHNPSIGGHPAFCVPDVGGGEGAAGGG